MAPRDWRNPEDYAHLPGLDLSSLAWEFLRRNSRYQQAYETSSSRRSAETSARPFGLRFPIDPAREPAEAAVFWRIDIAPAHALAFTRSALGGVTAAELQAIVLARTSSADGLWLKLPRGLQVVIPRDAGTGEPLALTTPLDGHLAVRLSAAEALRRVIEGRPQPAPSRSTLSRRRATLMLRACDGRTGGASYREVAAHLLAAAPEGGAAWRVSNARDVAIRLCRAAQRAVKDGYLRLLAQRG